MANKRKYRRVVASVFNTPWAILPEKMGEITEILDLRLQGTRLSNAEIRARIQHARGPANPPDTPQIAVLNLFGTISQRMNFFSEFSGGTSTEQFGRVFDAAVESEDITAIVINTDSPGGAVPGVRELADKIHAARGTKPIIALANPMMASAAYWIASAADEVVAAPSADGIGSIGVLFVHREKSEADAKLGVKHTIIKSSDFKAEANPFEPLSEAARDHLEDEVRKIHADFVDAVARNRGVSAARVEADFGRGRTFLAQDAVSAGLVDRIATLETLLKELGVGAESSPNGFGARQHRQQPDPKRNSKMDPKLLTLLVRLGASDADETSANAFLDQFYSRYGKPRPEAEEQILADLEAATQIVTPQDFVKYVTSGEKPQAIPAASASTQTPNDPPQEGVEVAEILAAVNLATSIPPEARLQLQTSLANQAKTLTWNKVLDAINEESQKHAQPAGPTNIRTSEGERDKFLAAARDAVLVRSWGPGQQPKQVYDFRTQEYVDWKPTAGGRNYGLMSLPKLAEKCLVYAGLPAQQVDNLPLMSIARLVMGADPASLGIGFAASANGPAYNLSGMFSNILLDAANVMLRRSYDETRATFSEWMRQGPSVMDFKTVNKVIAGELGDPKAIPEDGEFEETTLSDGKETYKLTVWGEVFSHSWQLVVNDRLNSFSEIPMKLGRAMVRKQNRLAYQELKDNANLADGGALFNATAITTTGGHNNLSTGALTTVADYISAFNTMTQKMGEQKGLDTSNSHVLNLMPVYIVYPMALRGIVRQTLGSPSGDTTNPGLTNIWQQGLTPIEEGELGSTTTGGSDTAFYHAASPMDVDTIEYAYLQGLESPVIEQEVAFDRLAMRQRIYQAFAVKPLDYRGLQKHTGA